MRARVTAKWNGVDYGELWQVETRDEAVQRIQAWVNYFYRATGLTGPITYEIGNEGPVVIEEKKRITQDLPQ